MSAPARGEVWLADLNPVRGHEQAGRRPVLVVSEDLFNQGPAGLAIVLPMTSTIRNVPSHVPVSAPEGGVKTPDGDPVRGRSLRVGRATRPALGRRQSPDDGRGRRPAAYPAPPLADPELAPGRVRRSTRGGRQPFTTTREAYAGNTTRPVRTPPSVTSTRRMRPRSRGFSSPVQLWTKKNVLPAAGALLDRDALRQLDVEVAGEPQLARQPADEAVVEGVLGRPRREVVDPPRAEAVHRERRHPGVEVRSCRSRARSLPPGAPARSTRAPGARRRARARCRE